jgi:hypothetical protein
MAIAAVNPQPGYVVLVAERHRLRLPHARVCYVRRALNLHRHPAQRSNYEYRAKYSGARQRIRTAMEDLRHSLMIVLKETRRIIPGPL